MAAFLAPLVPLALRYGPRLLLLATAAWTGTRLVQSGGDPKKAFVALREDVVRTYQFFTGDESRKLKDAGDQLQKKGGDIATFATALLALVEFVSGVKLTEAKKAVTGAKAVLDAYNKLSPADKRKVSEVSPVDIPEEVQKALQKHLYTMGLHTLNDTNVEGISTPAQFLCRKYTGLFYIGRSGHQLMPEEIDGMLAATILHLHEQIGTDVQQPLIAWWRNIGVSVPGADLIKRLQECPEVAALGVDVRYIAYALHQNVPGLKFGPLEDDLVKRLQQ